MTRAVEAFERGMEEGMLEDDCQSLDMSVGDADVHIARDGEIVFSPKMRKGGRSVMEEGTSGDRPLERRLMMDEAEDEEDEEAEEDDDFVPYNSAAVLAALRALQDKIRQLESERNEFSRRCHELEQQSIRDSKRTAVEEMREETNDVEKTSLTTLRHELEEVRTSRDALRKRCRDLRSQLDIATSKQSNMMEGRENNVGVVDVSSSETSKDVDVFGETVERLSNRLAMTEMRCTRLEAENARLKQERERRRMKRGPVKTRTIAAQTSTKKKRSTANSTLRAVEPRRKKLGQRSRHDCEDEGRSRWRPRGRRRTNTKVKRKQGTKKVNLHERLLRANRTPAIPFIPSGGPETYTSHSLIAKVQTALADEHHWHYRPRRAECNQCHAEDAKIASLSVLRRLREIL